MEEGSISTWAMMVKGLLLAKRGLTTSGEGHCGEWVDAREVSSDTKVSLMSYWKDE